MGRNHTWKWQDEGREAQSGGGAVTRGVLIGREVRWLVREVPTLALVAVDVLAEGSIV